MKKRCELCGTTIETNYDFFNICESCNSRIQEQADMVRNGKDNLSIYDSYNYSDDEIELF